MMSHTPSPGQDNAVDMVMGYAYDATVGISFRAGLLSARITRFRRWPIASHQKKRR